MITDLQDITSFKWATIASSSPLSILLDGDTAPLALVPDSLIDPRLLWPGDRVRVELSLRKAVIHGKSAGVFTDSPRFIDMRPLPLANGWSQYDKFETGWTRSSYGKSADGIVVLNGLIMGGTLAVGTVIATLPPGYRPDYSMIWGVNNSDTNRAISIFTNGDIVIRGAITANFISLAGISFPAAGVASWTTIGAAGSGSSWANSWGPHVDTQFGPPRYWMDPYGMVWVQGLIAGGSTAAYNTPMISLPASHMAKRYNHINTASSDQFGFVGIDWTGSGASASILWKSGTTGNNWVTLSGVVYESVASVLTWTVPLALSGSSNLGDAFTQAEYANINGLVHTHGMLSVPTLPVIPFYYPIGSRPGQQAGRGSLFNRVAGAARGRADLNRQAQDGALQLFQGTAGSWFSLDALTFPALS